MKIESLLLTGVLLLASCSPERADDRHTVFKEAERFATLAFVEEQFDQAYNMLTDKERARIELSYLKNTLRSLHRRHAVPLPTRITATEHRVRESKGGEAIAVYLVGDQRPAPMHYLVWMRRVGDSYYPDGLESSPNPIPDRGQARFPVGPVIVRAAEQEDAPDEGLN